MTCVDLMEIGEIRQEAEREFGKDFATNKISDTLGFMWRREFLTRYACTINGDEGGVTLEFDKFSILIRPKK